MSEATRGGDPSQASADPLGLRSLSVTCATVSDQRPQTPTSSARNRRRRKKREKEEEEEGKKRQHTNIVAKLRKNGLKSPGVTTRAEL